MPMPRPPPPSLDGGYNGHLVFVMTDTQYVVITTIPYDVPSHPGAQPIHRANATGGAQITKANHQYDALLDQVS